MKRARVRSLEEEGVGRKGVCVCKRQIRSVDQMQMTVKPDKQEMEKGK